MIRKHRLSRALVLVAVLGLLFCFMKAATAESLWKDSGGTVDLYADKKASNVGDIITILVFESATATNKASTNTGKNVNATLGGNGLFSFIPEAGVDMGNGFSGGESTSRTGNLVAKISAKVVEVLPNGNLKIEGTRTVVVNKEQQDMTISGIIRPEDVAADNTVLSSLVADAQIRFTGNPELQQSGGFFSNLWNGFMYLMGMIF